MKNQTTLQEQIAIYRHEWDEFRYAHTKEFYMYEKLLRLMKLPPDTPQACSLCNGAGVLDEPAAVAAASDKQWTCPGCGGTGKMW